MRVNLEWLREWVELGDAESVAADLTTSGLEVEAIEPLAAVDSNIVVAEVLEVARHRWPYRSAIASRRVRTAP